MKYPRRNGEILECDIGFMPEELVEMTTKENEE